MRQRPQKRAPSASGLAARIAPVLVAATMMGAGGVAAAAPESTRVLVKLDQRAPTSDRSQVGPALGATAQTALGSGWQLYEVPGAVSESEALTALSTTRADVAVELDLTSLRPSAIATDPQVGEQWALNAVRAGAAWDRPATAPVTVAVIDTGIDLSHPDLAGAAWTNPGEVAGNGVDDDGNGFVDDVNGWDFANNDASVFDDPVLDAHGTNVAGVVAASRNNGFGMAGLSSNARVMALKFIDGPDGSAGSAIQALRYAQNHGARVVSASFGGPYSQALCDAIATAAAAGITVVAAAGNDGLELGEATRVPATCPEVSVISVAASTAGDGLAAFSNRGAITVDLAAPGESVLTTAVGGGHETVSGTSIATPHVAAAAALILGQNPVATSATVKRVLLETAARSSAFAGLTVSGGRLDVGHALGAPPAVVAPFVAINVAEMATTPTGLGPRLVRLVAAAGTLSLDRVVRVRYQVTEPTLVRFTIRRAGSGAVVATFRRRATAGDNVLLLSSATGTARRLPHGRYKITAATPAGEPITRSVTFDIVSASAFPRARPAALATREVR
jgi:thermitase